MATPQELVARDDARKAREAAITEAKQRAKVSANDNRPRQPDGYLDMGDGEDPMPYWLPPEAKPRDTA